MKKFIMLLIPLLLAAILLGCAGQNAYKIKFDPEASIRMTVRDRALICAGISDELLKQPVSVEVTEEVRTALDDLFGGRKVTLSDSPYAGAYMVKISSVDLTLQISDSSQVIVTKDGLWGSFDLSEKETEALYEILRNADISN